MEFIKTKDELDILKALYENLSIKANTEDAQFQLIDLLAKWKVYIGLSKDTNPQELILISSYIIDKFPTLTVAEISLAMDLHILSKLNKDIEHYGNFSIQYVCDVINAYIYYRRQTLSEFIKKRDDYQLSLEREKNKITPEEDMELTKKIISDFYKQYQDTGMINDIMNICYKFISQNKLMVFTEELIKNALDFGKIQVKLDAQRNNMSIDTYIKNCGLPIEHQEKVHSRNFCVCEFFENNTLESILGMINVSQFVKQ